MEHQFLEVGQGQEQFLKVKMRKFEKNNERVRTVNCYQCGIKLTLDEVVSFGKTDKTDKVFLCKKHDKIRKFGRIKLIPRK